MELKVGVLVAQRQSGYKDIPGRRYHFPKDKYLRDIHALDGALLLFYEPRRGGSSAHAGGRMGFVASAFFERIEDDPDDTTHAFLWYRFYCEFVNVVPLQETSLSPKSLQRAVRPLSYSEAEHVVHLGLTVEIPDVGARSGLTDTDALRDVPEREIRAVVRNQAIRDASFRFRVVDDAYDGRCAFTGIKITNGNGRAEVDAAHMQSVEAGGPDATRNGLALMKSMHWAFDRGLVSLTDDGQILTVERGLEDSFLKLLPPDRRAILPTDAVKAPHPVFLEWHRTNCFKNTVRAS